MKKKEIKKKTTSSSSCEESVGIGATTTNRTTLECRCCCLLLLLACFSVFRAQRSHSFTQSISEAESLSRYTQDTTCTHTHTHNMESSERELSPFQQVYFFWFRFLFFLPSSPSISMYCVYSFVHTSAPRSSKRPFSFGDEELDKRTCEKKDITESSIAQTSAKERWMRYWHPIPRQ